MPKTIVDWIWEEAFEKFGFGDGDGLNMTDEIAGSIEAEFPELKVRKSDCGLHNYMIFDITNSDDESVYLVHPLGKNWLIGYDNPRDYLPDYIVTMLDSHYPED